MKDNFINSSLAAGQRHPGEISLHSIIVFFRSNIYLILIITLTSIVLGGFYALISPPVYQATSSIRVEVGAPTPSSNLPVSLAGLFEARSAAASEIEMIRTNIVLGDVVERLDLNLRAEPKRFPILGRWIAKGSSSLHKPGLLGFGGYAWGS
jgi:tyrosine-protein kinase Etk/Wzc